MWFFWIVFDASILVKAVELGSVDGRHFVHSVVHVGTGIAVRQVRINVTSIVCSFVVFGW